MQKSEIIQIIKEELKLLERELTDKELKRRDKIADELPDAEFKKRYGKDYKSVKYATATKMAKREENDPEDGKAAPHGSGYNVVKEYNIQALRSLRKVVTEGELTEDYSQRARNFRVALRRRLASMKKGQKLSYGKLVFKKLNNQEFTDNKGTRISSEEVVQDLKRAVQPDIMKHRGAAGDGMVDAYLKIK